MRTSTVVAIFVLAFVLGTGSCAAFLRREPRLGKETQRLISPDNQFAAVVLSDDWGGATGSRVDNVYIVDVREGSFRNRLQVHFAGSLKSEKTTLKLAWQGDRKLVVQYRNLHVISFDNRAFATEASSDGIEIVLQRL